MTTIRTPGARPPVRVVGAVLGALLLAAACSGDDGDDASAEGVPAEEAAAPVGAAVTTAQTQLGEVLVDPSGLTLYAFTEDVDGTSTCVDTCATAWPPVDGDLAVAEGLEELGFDTITREDGSTQLRIAGRWPLYTFAGDAGPGDVNGQASAGVWFAVGADGSLIGLDDAGDGANDPAEAGTDGSDDAAGGDEEATGAGDGDGASPDGAVGADQVLTVADGFTVYAFTNDEPNVSNCYEPCSTTWPPVEAGTELVPAPEESRLRIVERDDGISQLSLDGNPLYTYVGDEAPGDVNGQGVGDVWFAVGTDGEVLEPPAVRIGSTDAGDVLIDPEGFTLYTFANDRPGVSNCGDPCSTTWPPVPGTVELGETLDPAQFGQITRDDGQSQLTFEGLPLYRYSGDENPGDANGVLVGAEGAWAPVPGSAVRTVEASDPSGSAAGGTGDGYGEGAGGEPVDPPAEPAGPDADVSVAETSLGAVLVDAQGRTLYGFTEDTPDASSCDGACADAWPPVPADVAVAAEVTAEIGAVTRPDGSEQLVVGAWPAYTFSGDAGPGDVNGQGSGGVWFALAPDGSLVR